MNWIELNYICFYFFNHLCVYVTTSYLMLRDPLFLYICLESSEQFYNILKKLYSANKKDVCYSKRVNVCSQSHIIVLQNWYLFYAFIMKGGLVIDSNVRIVPNDTNFFRIFFSKSEHVTIFRFKNIVFANIIISGIFAAV